MTLTDDLRAAFRLVGDDWAFLGGRAWIAVAHTTFVCRFLTPEGLTVSAKLKIDWDGEAAESLRWSTRVGR